MASTALRRLSVPSLCLALLVTGCYAAHDPRGGPDPVLPDAARADGGRAMGADAGRRLPDGGPRVRDGGTACPRSFADYVGPGCAPATGECLRECGDDVTCNECFAADEECGRCVNTVIIACANRAGCGDEWADYACCAGAVPACAGLTDVDLLRCGADCAAELSVYTECVNAGPAMMCSADLGARCGVF